MTIYWLPSQLRLNLISFQSRLTDNGLYLRDSSFPWHNTMPTEDNRNFLFSQLLLLVVLLLLSLLSLLLLILLFIYSRLLFYQLSIAAYESPSQTQRVAF